MRIFKWIGGIFLAVVVFLAIAAFWAIGPGNVSRMFLGIGISYDEEAPELPELKRPAILIFSKTNGFRDNAQIKAANSALLNIARERGWSAYQTENAAVFNARQLGQFKAVVWNSVSGDVLTTAQRAAFKSWLEQGGGYVGLHGAGGDPSYAWKWYVDEVIGVQFIGHTLDPQIQSARLIVEDADHPATRHLGSEWDRTDEWYSFGSNPRAKGYKVLVTIDEASYSPHEKIPLLVDKDLSMGRDHPMVWTHCIGDGRAFYSALGHQAEAYAEPKHLEMIGGAIAWAAGLEGSRCTDGKQIEGDSE